MGDSNTGTSDEPLPEGVPSLVKVLPTEVLGLAPRPGNGTLAHEIRAEAQEALLHWGRDSSLSLGSRHGGK